MDKLETEEAKDDDDDEWKVVARHVEFWTDQNTKMKEWVDVNCKHLLK